MSDRYGWQVDPADVREQTDLIQALQLILRLGTRPGDAVVIQTPNYPPFLATIETMGRRTVEFPFVDTENGWALDFDEFERTLAQNRPKVLVLVNPHNPTGRVHTRGETRAHRPELAERYGLLVISDEIHAELIYQPHRHIPFASISEDAASRTVTVTSAGKAFNLAGLRCAVLHYGPKDLLAVRDNESPRPLRRGVGSRGRRMPRRMAARAGVAGHPHPRPRPQSRTGPRRPDPGAARGPAPPARGRRI